MYIRSEDRGIVFVGPFPSQEAAAAHINLYFPDYRKQPGYLDQIVDTLPEGELLISPEQDAVMWAEEADGPDPDKEFSLNAGDTWVTLDDIRQLWALLTEDEQRYVHGEV